MNKLIAEFTLHEKHKIQLVQADITQENVDAIVNAANSQLQHGGGVAGAIVYKGGIRIQAESDKWIREHGPISHTTPAYTNAGNLPCRYVIHAVGPVWGSGNEEKRLSATVECALKLADELEVKSLALPAISTGIFGFPRELAAKVILESIKNHFSKNTQSSLDLVRVTLFDQPTVDSFLLTWKTIFRQ